MYVLLHIRNGRGKSEQVSTPDQLPGVSLRIPKRKAFRFLFKTGSVIVIQGDRGAVRKFC